ncbi:MAG: ribbon-helix-helix protein, CopG family [bacterium]|nr:ribbon-helix-helix protein, CopG family [bacterium]MBU1917877.1 ribbon-helix-helix protein, CopG family [bacterium]
MRTIISISQEYLVILSRIAQKMGLSRAEVIRRAIKDFIDLHRSDKDQAFGLWQDRDIDSLTYQEKLRSEWE